MVKYVMAYLLLAVLGFSILIIADLISGISFKETLSILTHSFVILTPIEYILIPAAAIFPLLPIARSLLERVYSSKMK